MGFWGALRGALAAFSRVPATPVAEPPAAPSQGLLKPSAFYAALRVGNLLGPVLSQDEVNGCGALTQALKGLPLSHAAYGLATAYHETAHTMQPVKEIGGEAYYTRMYDIAGNRPEVAKRLGNVTPGDGARYCGRGYVQLTGRTNYAKAGRALGVDLIGTPDLALRSDVAARIMRWGMVGGTFTGKSFHSFLPSEAVHSQFVAARAIINGSDRAEQIAEYAGQFQSALKLGAWA